MNSLNILVALPYMNKLLEEYIGQNPHIRFLFDSGAFTAWKQGSEITLDQWCSFMNSMKIKPWRYFTLDKIGDPIGTRNNFLELKRRGFDPMPIFTRGENLGEIDWMYSQTDVIGIGGLVGTSGNKAFVNGIMKKIAGRPCHWLGFTSHDYVSHYRPYSCDSSSWSGAVRFATLKLYAGRGRWITVRKDTFKTKPSDEILNIFREYEEDPRRMGFSEDWQNSGKGDRLLEVMTYKSWARYQIDAEKILKVKFFLACASMWQVRLMNEALTFWNNHPLYRVGSKTPESLKDSIRSTQVPHLPQ